MLLFSWSLRFLNASQYKFQTRHDALTHLYRLYSLQGRKLEGFTFSSTHKRHIRQLAVSVSLRFSCYHDTTVPAVYRSPAHHYRVRKPVGHQPPLFAASDFGATVDFTLALSKLNPRYEPISTAKKSRGKQG